MVFPVAKDYLPEQVYKELNRACRDKKDSSFFSFLKTPPESPLFTTKQLYCNSESTLSYKGQSWCVEMWWGTDSSTRTVNMQTDPTKIHALFLLIYSENDLFVQVYDSQKQCLLDYPFEGEKFDFTQADFSDKIFVRFPGHRWDNFVQTALDRNLLPNTRCDIQRPTDITTRVFGEPLSTPSGPRCCLKILLGLGALFIAYKIFRVYQAKT